MFLTAGSRRQDLLGRNVLSVALDEGNFRLEKDPDQFQSEMLLQTLQGRRLATGHLSVDRNKSVYETWRNAVEGHQIRLY